MGYAIFAGSHWVIHETLQTAGRFLFFMVRCVPEARGGNADKVIG